MDRRSHFIIGVPLALIVGYIFFGNPNVSFESSDGQWADHELQFKGVGLKSVVENFEAYKIDCHAPNARLVRTTPQYWFNIFSWPSYLTDKKWHVPLAQKHPGLDGYHEPECQQQGGWPDAAKQNADRFLSGL